MSAVRFLTMPDGARLACRVDGRTGASPLVFANSLAADHGMWNEVAGLLEDRFQLIRFDARGHGQSSGVLSDVARYCDDLMAILDAFGLEQAAICGLSLGGVAAMALAAAHPRRVSALALANTTAAFLPPQMWEDRASQVISAGVGPMVAPTMERWLTRDYHASHPERSEEIAAMIAMTSPAGYAGGCRLLAATDLRPSLAAIAAPALILAGRRDPSTPLALSRELADGIAKAKLIELDAAHLSAVEAPAAFADALAAFLQEDK